MGKGDPSSLYAIDPEHMQQGIDWYLTPVIDDLGTICASFTAAHGEVTAANGGRTPGWFGGEGNGKVPAATSAFLQEVGKQLQALIADQTELAASLTDYRAVLQQHMTWARETDLRQADEFRAIERDLDARGR